MENLLSIGLGGLGGVIAYAVARLALNGKYTTIEQCKHNHELFDKMFDRLFNDMSHRLDRLERKIDQLVRG